MKKASNNPGTQRCHYFVDEAGDGTLFNNKGRIIIGQEGCSRFFILGLVRIADSPGLANEMDQLRQDMLADPTLNSLPSMQPERQKTALFFHAKDDIPEVRREVFRLLMKHELSFHAAIKNKQKVAEYVRQRNQTQRITMEPGIVRGDYRYHPNELYDFLVRRLFKNLLLKHDEYQVCFAKRGSSDRTDALRNALETAQNRSPKPDVNRQLPRLNIEDGFPWDVAALQAVDYFLWALQRLYERREDRYWNYIQPVAGMVVDIDDTRRNAYGEYYTRKRPLSLAALEPLPEI